MNSSKNEKGRLLYWLNESSVTKKAKADKIVVKIPLQAIYLQINRNFQQNMGKSKLTSFSKNHTSQKVGFIPIIQWWFNIRK
jgi:hypothetical protein